MDDSLKKQVRFDSTDAAQESYVTKWGPAPPLPKFLNVQLSPIDRYYKQYVQDTEKNEKKHIPAYTNKLKALIQQVQEKNSPKNLPKMPSGQKYREAVSKINQTEDVDEAYALTLHNCDAHSVLQQHARNCNCKEE